MRMQDVMSCDSEYVKFAPVMQVVADARETAYLDMRCDEDGIIGEQIAEIGMERAQCSDTPMQDATRVWVYFRVQRALERYAQRAPRHADACDYYRNSMPV